MMLIVSGKHERFCTQCKHSFWAFDTGRTVCRICQPDTAEQAAKLRREIDANRVGLNCAVGR